MQGNLKQLALPEVLQFVSMGKSSGRLTVKAREGAETTLVIHNGRIINSTSLERQRRLGDLLVHRGILRRSVLAQVLTLQRTVESDKRLGEILVERDIVQESTIREVLRLQLEEEIWNLFGLDEGEFRFEQVDDDKVGEASVMIDIEPLLLEGTRRQDEWRKIVRAIPSDRLIPCAKKPSGEDARFRLSPAEWKVLAQVNGKFPVRAIINRSGMGRFEVYQILADFLRRQVVEIKKADGTQTGSSAAVPAEGKPAPAPSAAPAKSGGVGGLLSMFTGGLKREDRGEKIAFVSPVGAVAHLVNRVFEQFLSAKETKATAQDQQLLEALWHEMLMSFTRADLIQAAGNQLHTGRFEQFLQAFEFSDATLDVFEDSLEACLQCLDALYRIFAQRAGERVASKAVREMIDDTAARMTLAYAKDFKFAERVQTVLRLAA